MAPIYAAERAYQITGHQVLPGDVTRDFLSFDMGSERLFTTRSNHVDLYHKSVSRVVAAAVIQAWQRHTTK